MKNFYKISVFLIMVLCVTATSAQIVPPYSEDFETNDGGWVSGGTQSSWAYGVPTGPFINSSAPCDGGVNAWVTNLTGPYNNSEDSYIESPQFDFSSLTADPTLVFQHIYQTEGCCDEGWVEVSIDGGTVWTKVGTSGTGQNWYNDAGNDWWDGTAGSGTWQTASNVLTGTAGQADVRIRFIFNSDGSVTDDGFGVDNITVTETFDNAGVSALVGPIAGCGMGAAESIEITITNSGTSTINTIDLCYAINAGAPVCETATITIAPGASANYIFTTTADFSVAGSYNLQLYSNLTGDAYACDDTLLAVLESQATVSTFPYSEDFESGSGGWLTSGTFNSWQLGTPSGSYISGVAPCGAGNTAWVTNLGGFYNNDELSHVESPCLDFSGLGADPTLVFSLIYNSEQDYDGGYIEFSTDGGTIWSKLGTFGSGSNWYNNGAEDWWDDNSPNGAGQWITASHVLTGLAGQANVKLRMTFESDGSVNDYEGVGFDNILITETYVNAGPTALVSPLSGCGLTNSETVEVTISNTGNSTINTIDLCYTVNAGAPVCETATVTIIPGGTANYAFTATADLSVAGSYDIVVYSTLAGDVFPCDDTLAVNVQSQATISTFPYSEDFESGAGGWIASGTSSSWALGTPSATYITGTDSCNGGNTAWVTNLTGPYNNDEISFVESPCLDFSGLTSDPILAFDHIYQTEGCCDEGYMEYSTDGGTVWTTLGASGGGQNWYNDGGNDWWDGSSVSGAGNWQVAYHPLTGLAGQASVKIRYVFQSDGSVTDDGFGFDNILITTGMVHVSADSVGYTAACTYSNAEVITGHFFNHGPTDLTTLDVCYTVNAGAPVCETITASIPAGAVYSYAFTATADLSAQGNYDVVVYANDATDINVCDDSTMTTIVHPMMVNLVDSVLCTGDSLLISSGVSNATYLWSTGATTPNIYVNTTGQYYVDVTDNATGCVSTDTVVVTETDIVLTATSMNEILGSDGSVDLTVANGTAPYTYNWSNSATTEDLTGITGGSYDVVVTDANGCMDSLNVVVTSEVGISENDFHNYFDIYPNPAKAELFIKPVGGFTNETVGEIRDASGKLVMQFNFTGQDQLVLDISTMEGGIYFINVIVEGEVKTAKLIKN